MVLWRQDLALGPPAEPVVRHHRAGKYYPTNPLPPRDLEDVIGGDDVVGQDVLPLRLVRIGSQVYDRVRLRHPVQHRREVTQVHRDRLPVRPRPLVHQQQRVPPLERLRDRAPHVPCRPCNHHPLSHGLRSSK